MAVIAAARVDLLLGGSRIERRNISATFAQRQAM
jgi:hypothetical protein